MISFWKQVYLLQWKNAKLKQRNPILTVLEVLAPLFTFFLLIAIRNSQDFFLESKPCQFKPSPLVSKGPLALLRSFCFLGICRQEHQTFHPDSGIFNDEEYRNITKTLKLVNGILANPTVKKFTGAIATMPTNLSDPKQTKQLKFGSMFQSNSSRLFDGVTATKEQKADTYNAVLPFPKRWDLSLEPTAKLTLKLMLQTTDALPALVCNSNTDVTNSTGNWAAVKALCKQQRFRDNLKSQFDLDATVKQMTSTDANKYTIYLTISDIQNLPRIFLQLNQLSKEGTLTLFKQKLDHVQSLSGIQDLTQFAILSNMLCGSSDNIMGKYTGQLKRFSFRNHETVIRSGNNSVIYLKEVGPTRILSPSNESSIPKLTSIVPPEQFCYKKEYHRAVTGLQDFLSETLGLVGILNIMFGVIPFYPDVPKTRKFLSKLNGTLQDVSKVSYFAENFTQSDSPRIRDYIANSSQMAFVRMAITLCYGALGNQTAGPMCQSMSNFLSVNPDVPDIPDINPDIEPPSGSNSSIMGMGNWKDLLRTMDLLMYRLYYATACFRMNKLIGFNSVKSLDNYTDYLIDEFNVSRKIEKPLFVASLLFDNHTSGFVKYRLRFEEKEIDHTRNFKVVDAVYKVRARSKYPNDFKYFTSLFVHIQELLEHGIQAAITGVDAPLQSYLTMLPSACFVHDTFASVMGSFLPMIMTISWIYNVSLLVNAIVYEKETRLKEMMKIMGLSDGIHWVSWFITTFIIMLIASALMTLLLKTGQLVVYSNPLLLFFFILSFVVSTICEAFFISIFFSNSSVAAAFAGVIYFLGYVPFGVIDRFSDSMTRPQYFLSCLIPQLAFGVGCKLISNWEMASVGLQSNNFFDSPLSTGEFSFNLVILMMWVDSGILMLLTWYLEKVFPGAYGVPKRWYFLFTPSFWCGNSKKKLLVNAEDGAGGANANNIAASASSVASTPGSGFSGSSNSSLERPADSDGAVLGVEMNGRNPEHFEEEPRHLNVGIALRNLTKIYAPGMFACKKNAKPFTAVDNLSYNFYEGHVTSFLGHNGAGKSTTMSVLTGLYTPTSGTAYIAGHDIRTDMDEIRKHLGLCPQHNVLFDSLTVEDHIYFYGMLKGLSKAEVEPQIDAFIADVGLEKKKFEISKNLSGGMKRKLSVAMAFVGGSKVIVLDEPTAGVDPHARRAIWDVLAKFRRGRTIILTTHHMDEADILGDRICIINKGRLVCSGSPMFLKKVFGEGYTLTMVKASPQCDTETVLDLVQSQVPEASTGECTSSEINVKLPYNSLPKLADLFTKLDESLIDLKIASYGIEDSSLEEIFLAVTLQPSDELLDDSSVVQFRPSQRESVRLRQLEQALSNNAEENNMSEPSVGSSASSRPSEPRKTQHPLWQQVKALWLKRLHVMRRSKIGFLAQLVLPAIFILLALSLLQIVPRDGDNPPMELAPWYMLGKPERALLKYASVFQSRSLTGYKHNATLTGLSNRLMSHINSTDFLGTRCMRKELFSNADFPCKTQHRDSTWSPAPSNLPSNTSWCQCSYKDYPNSAKCVDWPTPARKYLKSADILESMQGYNLTNYVQSTVAQYFRQRFGGYTLFVNDSQPVNENAVSANSETQQLLRTIGNLTNGNVTDRLLDLILEYLQSSHQRENLTSLVNQIWYDNRGYVSGPAYLNTLTNAVMRALADRSLGSPDEIGVSGWTHPITSVRKNLSVILNKNIMLSVMTVVSIIFALSFIPASFVMFLISERTTNAKHLQFVSGINPALYWIVNHAWNMLNYLVPLTIIILLFVGFKNYEFVGSETIGPFLLTMILFGFASAPLMYPFSWVMSVPSKAFTMLSCLNLGVGFITTMTVSFVSMIGSNNDDQAMINTADTLKKVFLLLPHFCLGQSLMELSEYYTVKVHVTELRKRTGIQDGLFTIQDSGWEPTTRYLQCMGAHSVVYFCLVLLLEYNCCCKQGLVSARFFRLFYRGEYEKSLRQPDPAEVDDDVRAEAAKVEGRDGGSNSTDGPLLELRRLVKIFSTSSGPKAAVKGISLQVKSHECFGFLGVNGAGKTTTFKMLTGDLTPTSGDAHVGGFSILTEALEVHKQLGYCPQFDALLPLLTGRETLQLYARIRGVEETDINHLVETISKRVGIDAHLDKTVGEYSGGNKRKLSCGIAFIGNPPIVFLDEPTAGMDPGARRFLWRCIQRMVTAGSCVILTTHSMEDCQALCHRLTIMVNGRFQCIGSPQHLKNKFGQGFTIFLRVRHSGDSDASDTASTDAAVKENDGTETRAHNAFMSAFPDAVLKENHATVLQYQLKQTVKLKTIFATVQGLKDKGLVLDYSVNQTTLDQVFINFAKHQSEQSH